MATYKAKSFHSSNGVFGFFLQQSYLFLCDDRFLQEIGPIMNSTSTEETDGIARAYGDGLTIEMPALSSPYGDLSFYNLFDTPNYCVSLSHRLRTSDSDATR